MLRLQDLQDYMTGFNVLTRFKNNTDTEQKHHLGDYCSDMRLPLVLVVGFALQVARG